MNEELQLVKNSTSKQIKQIIYNKKTKTKEKIVYFTDFIKKKAEDGEL